MQRFATRSFSTSRASRSLKSAYILGGARTPIGNFGGSLKAVSAVDLGIVAANGAIEKAGIKKSDVQEVYFGHVIQGNVGQAPARQVVIKGGFPETTEATTINKVCASGLKSVSLAVQAIQTGDRDVLLAGGMESMSNTPYYSVRNASFGNQQLTDSILGDGLTDVYNKIHMGLCCENTNKREGITREDQDNFAIESYKRAIEAQKNGGFDNEIVPVTIKTKKGDVVVSEDEAPKVIKFESVPKLRPAFAKDGTITAANASSLNDGAAALVVSSGSKAKELGANVVAKVIAYADAATAPIDFTIAPSKAVPILLKRAGLTVDDIAKWELNEAFAGVSIANNRILGLDPAKVNVKGGAVAIGHPIGASGARILVTLINNLKEGEYGVAGICNGGGAATTLLIQKVSKVEDEVSSKL
ncbi:acetyl-CoA C-acetyltransferase [Sugiyamaella lignohabitans]|uniref:acetyl-CoA C-acetyltransferase n=1 Tax=Sugiyamaella lignohabitans TaxID=796027 RepID=A0A167EG32_9ASCO|nr:acetyl-CoA C-acetyltransferase [Sugiyamaella lignohabitans]ANB14038.1 acetyl-CoA C-acetyltransferase [Sugiyamaella lignohabitans]